MIDIKPMDLRLTPEVDSLDELLRSPDLSDITDDDTVDVPEVQHLCVDLSKSRIKVDSDLEILKDPPNMGEYGGNREDGLTIQQEDPNLGEYVPRSPNKGSVDKKKKKKKRMSGDRWKITGQEEEERLTPARAKQTVKIVLTKRRLPDQEDDSQEEEEEERTVKIRTINLEQSPTKERDWLFREKREQEKIRTDLEQKRERSRHEREERRMARNSHGENRLERLENSENWRRSERTSRAWKGEMDWIDDQVDLNDPDDKIVQEEPERQVQVNQSRELHSQARRPVRGERERGPHHQHVTSGHLSQLVGGTSGVTGGRMKEQAEMKDNDWRGRKDLTSVATDKEEINLYNWMVINLISDLSVTTKDGDLNNTRAESFTCGAAVGGTATTKTRLSHWRDMKQETQSEIQAAITETWVRDKINPSGQGVEEDVGTIDSSLEDSLGDGTSMEVGRIPKTSVEEEVPARPQMEDFMVASTSRQCSVTEGSLGEEVEVSPVSTEDATVLHVEDSGIFQLSMDQAGQSQ